MISPQNSSSQNPSSQNPSSSLDSEHGRGKIAFGDLSTRMICVLLTLAVLAVFGQTAGFTFINLDDHDFVDGNPIVMQGLTVQGTVWAFTKSHRANWHPVTTLSHMLDCAIFGRYAQFHHLENVLIHAAAAILLFLALQRMTGSKWRSAFVAALFAVHPLRAESVAWVTERKDVLCGFFFMLTLLAYARYVERPSSRRRYLLVVLWLVLGLMSKAMLVTTPFVLLLLDYWPLRRMPAPLAGGAAESTDDRRGAGQAESPQQAAASRQPPSRQPIDTVPAPRLVLEKIPLLAISAAVCALTLSIQGNAIYGIDWYSPSWRFGNVLISYITYLDHFFYPVGLAASYPRLERLLPLWRVVDSGVILAAVTAAAFACRRKYPAVLVGWLWYVGMFLPVIGVFQIGGVSVADRLTYLPQIGLGIALTWGFSDLCREWRRGREACLVVSFAWLMALMACAWHETSFWRNSEMLWRRGLECTSNACDIHYCLGLALYDNDKVDEAVSELEKAVAIQYKFPQAHSYLGVALCKLGRFKEAEEHFRIAVKLDPKFAEGHNHLGVFLADQGRQDEAEEQYRIAMEIEPEFEEPHNNLANRLLLQGKVDEAIKEYETALKLDPLYADAHCNLGKTLVDLGEPREGLAHYETALRNWPDHVATMSNLAWLRATCQEDSLRNGAQAVELAQRADKISKGKRPDILVILAAAYAETGQFSKALETARRAVRLATEQNKPDLVKALQVHIGSYKARQPIRQ